MFGLRVFEKVLLKMDNVCFSGRSLKKFIQDHDVWCQDKIKKYTKIQKYIIKIFLKNT